MEGGARKVSSGCTTAADNNRIILQQTRLGFTWWTIPYLRLSKPRHNKSRPWRAGDTPNCSEPHLSSIQVNLTAGPYQAREPLQPP